MIVFFLLHAENMYFLTFSLKLLLSAVIHTSMKLIFHVKFLDCRLFYMSCKLDVSTCTQAKTIHLLTLWHGFGYSRKLYAQKTVNK